MVDLATFVDRIGAIDVWPVALAGDLHQRPPHPRANCVCAGQAYAAAYRLDPADVREAAYHRARAMVYSDAWVISERDPDSPLLLREQNELLRSYAALRRVVGR